MDYFVSDIVYGNTKSWLLCLQIYTTLSGTHIITDAWKPYSSLGDLGNILGWLHFLSY